MTGLLILFLRLLSLRLGDGAKGVGKVEESPEATWVDISIGFPEESYKKKERNAGKQTSSAIPTATLIEDVGMD